MQTITKRLFSLAVALVMVFAMLPGTLQVSAEETEPADHLAHCICGGTYDGCGHDHLSGEWKPWDGKSAIAEGGNYYLTQDVTGSTQYWMGGTHQNTTAMTINLCLNGHSIDSNYRVFGIAPYVTFNLMNCSATKSVLKGCAANGDNGCVIHIHAATSTLNLYGNIRLEGKQTSGRVVTSGGAVNNNGTFNMYGGELYGMKVGGAVAKTADGVTTYTAHRGEGSVIRMATANSKFTMYGGRIYSVDCYTSSETKVNADGTGFTGRSVGGAIFMNNGASFAMKGGEIYGSYVGDGGVVYATGSNTKITIEGGTIYAGRAAFGGGAFKLEGGMDFTMTGGLIEGNHPDNYANNAGGAGGGAIMADFADLVIKGTARIRNCSTTNLGGAIKARSSSTVTLGGDIQIIENGIWTFASNNIYLDGSVKITVDGLTSKAKVGVSAAYDGAFTTNTVSADVAKAFSGDADYTGTSGSASKCHTVSRSSDGYMTIAYRNTASHANHCVCGGHDADCKGHSELTNWIAWDGKSSITASGNYYLTQAPEEGQKWLGTVSDAAANQGLVINICLNGFGWYSGNRVFGVGTGTTVNIMNCSEAEGRLTSMSNGDQGGVIFAQADTKISIYDNVYIGTIKGSTKVCKYGGAVVVGAGGEFYMYGGRITGRKVTQSGGGTICLESGSTGKKGGSFYMYDGYVADGVSYGNHGGNFRIGSNCYVEILGGVVENGKVYPSETADPTNKDHMDKNGGNLYLYDDVADEIRTTLVIGGDAVIRNGEGDRGGNIFQYAGHLIIQDNATIEGGVARNKGYGGGDQSIHVNRGKTPTMKNENDETVVNEKMACYVTVSGTPTINSIQYTDAMDVSGLKAGAKIGLNRAGAGLATTPIDIELAKDIFTSTDPSANRRMTIEHEGVASRNLTDHVHCLCNSKNGVHTGGCDGYEIAFGLKWSGIGSHTGFDSFSQSYTRYWRLSPENETLEIGQQWLASPAGGLTSTGEDASSTMYLCLDGYNLTSPGRIYGVGKNGKLFITNCQETGGVLKYGGHYNTADDPSTAAQAGAFLLQSGAQFGLYGNITVTYNEASTKIPSNAGVIDAPDGTKVIIDGATLNGCEVKADGGVIRVYGGGEVYIYNGVINGGSVGTDGGAIAAYGGSKVYVHGGTIQNGTAKGSGGNISLATGSELIMTGGTISGGTVTDDNDHGGNIYVLSDSHATITGGVIRDGKATGYGDSNGGNIAISDTNRNDTLSSLTIGGNAQILGGEANRGANLFLHSGNVVIGGNAKITNGVATDHTNGGGEDGELSGVIGGDAHGVLLNNTMNSFDSTLTVSGTPDIECITTRSTQIVVDGLEAGAKIGLDAKALGAITANPVSDEVAACFVTFDNTRTLYNTEAALLLVAKEGSNVLFDGQVMRFEDAVAQAAGTDKYIQLNADIDGDICVYKDVYLDLNGFDINGSVDIDDLYTLYAFDSTNTSYETAENYGKINGKVSGNLARAMNTPASFGHNYRIVAIYDVPEGAEQGNYSFHRIYFTLKSVVLTPYDTGINYKSVIKCSDFVAEHIMNGGIKLAGKDYLYGKFNLQGGAVENVKYAKVANVLDAGALGDLEKAQEKAETIVTAQALLQLSDGARIYSAETGKTLIDVITVANASFNSLTGRQQDALETMYARYSGLMAGWDDSIIGNIRNSAIKNADSDTIYHCYCYGTDATDVVNACSEAGHPQVAWTPWDRDYLPNVSGNYYLTQDYAVTETVVIKGGVQVALDLNGHSIISEAVNDPEDITDETQLLWINPNGSLIITDTVGTGKIVPVSDTNWQTGTGLAIRNYGAFAMYGGTIDATDVEGDFGVAIANMGTADLCGGSITGGTVLGSGGIVYNQGTFNMYGGTIENGNSATANHSNRGGGNLRLGGGVFTMYGGTITGGTAAYIGGNVYIGDGAAMIMHGGEIVGGYADYNGGTIAMMHDATFEMDGGVIYGGVAPNRSVSSTGSVSYSGKGAGIYAYATGEERITINITGGTIYGGAEQYSEEFPYATNNGGAIYADRNVDIYIEDATIYAGRILRGGAAIKVEHGVNLTLAGNTVIDGNHPDIASTDLNCNRGGAIFLESSNLVMKDNATIKNCRVDSYGGAIFVNRLDGWNSTLDFSGNAKIINCYTTADYTYGGGINLGQVNDANNATTMKLSGNVMISGNTAGAEKKAKSNLVMVEGVKVVVNEALTGSSVGVIATGEFATGSAVNASSFVSDTGATVTKKSNGNLAITSALKVGYATADINPTVDGTVSGTILEDIGLSGYGDNRLCTSVVQDNGLIASVLAFMGTDGEIGLVISMDQAALGDAGRRTIAAAITAKTGIPAANMVFNSNHQHSTPGGRTDYVEVMATNISAAAAKAVANFAPATMQKATINVNSGYAENAKFTYVRNYVLKNSSGTKVGMLTDNHSDASRVTYTSMAPESAADGEVQLLKITRTGASTIIVTNFQGHPHMMVGNEYDYNAAHADFIGVYRNQMKAYLGSNYEVMYMSGAGGNINAFGKSAAGGATGGTMTRAKILSDRVSAGWSKLSWTNLNGGELKIGTATNAYTARVNYVQSWINKSLDEVLAAAEEYDALRPNVSSSKQKKFLTEYGIYSMFHATAMLERRNNTADTKINMTVGALTVGDVAFCQAPYEMFDTNGQWLKTNSPFQMTFVSTLATNGGVRSGGNMGYIPSALGYTNGGYSTDITDFNAGTGEEAVQDIVDLLNSLK